VARLPDPSAPDGPGLFVKRYKFRDLRDRIRHVFTPAKPEVEWRVCRALAAAGIRTCDVLAIGLRRIHGMPREGFLVSREIPSVVTLRQFLRAGGQDARRSLVDELAEVTARLADAGFHHRDYHAGNILVRPDAAHGERLYIVDLHSIRIGRPRRRHMLRMLAMLDDSTRKVGAGREDRRAFLRAFLGRWQGGPGASDDSVRRWTWMARRAQRALHRRHMASRTRRCIVRSSLFTPDRAGGYRLHRRRDFRAGTALDAVERHRAALARNAPGCEVLRDGRKTQVTLCPCDAVPPLAGVRPAPDDRVGPGRVCVKAFVRAGPVQRLKDLLRPRSRARRAWIASHGLHVRGIPAPRPLALLERRIGAADYLITEAIPHDGDLGELAARGLPAGAWRRRLGCAIAGLLDRLAREEVRHPDTKPTNFLVGGQGDEVRLHLVDLDRMRFGTPATARTWIKNLAQLNAGLPADVTLLDRMRCLRDCSRGRWGRAERLRIARQVHSLSLERNPAWLRRPPPA